MFNDILQWLWLLVVIVLVVAGVWVAVIEAISYFEGDDEDS